MKIYHTNREIMPFHLNITWNIANMFAGTLLFPTPVENFINYWGQLVRGVKIRHILKRAQFEIYKLESSISLQCTINIVNSIHVSDDWTFYFINSLFVIHLNVLFNLISLLISLNFVNVIRQWTIFTHEKLNKVRDNNSYEWISCDWPRSMRWCHLIT